MQLAKEFSIPILDSIVREAYYRLFLTFSTSFGAAHIDIECHRVCLLEDNTAYFRQKHILHPLVGE